MKNFLSLLFLCILTQIIAQNTIRVIGHRGCRGVMPENTISGFQRAFEDGADGIEWDVVVNGEGKLVVSHEPYFHKDFCLEKNGETITNEKKYNIYKMTQEEIEAFDCGSKMHNNFPEQKKFKATKPLLKEVVELLPVQAYGKLILFEIKSDEPEYGISQPFPEDYVDLILAEVEAYRFTNIVYMSFDKNIIEALHKKAPELRLAYLTYLPSKSAKSYLKELSFKPFALGMFHMTINKRKLKQLRSNNVQVYAWTVNESKTAHNMMDLGIDAIITDYPRLIIQARGTYSDRPKRIRRNGTPVF
jgi:glycerophosphoryl diester phosphodiesterase